MFIPLQNFLITLCLNDFLSHNLLFFLPLFFSKEAKVKKKHNQNYNEAKILFEKKQNFNSLFTVDAF